MRLVFASTCLPLVRRGAQWLDRTMQVDVGHFEDRKKSQGATVPFGEGDVPLTELLRLVRDNRYRIPACIVHEYQSQDPVEEVRKGLAYRKRALLG